MSPRDSRRYVLSKWVSRLLIAILVVASSLSSSGAAPELGEDRQRKTSSECRTVGQAFMKWVASRGSFAPPTSASVRVSDYPLELTHREVQKILSPKFIAGVPELDAWGNPYEFHFSGDFDGPSVFLMRSPGRDGIYSTNVYEVGTFATKNLTGDIVFADGRWVQAPQGVATSTAGSGSSVASLIAYRDPVTGKTGPVPPGLRARLPTFDHAESSSSAVGLAAVDSPVPGGGEMVDLRGRFQSVMHLHTGEDGERQIGCGLEPAAQDAH